MHSESEPQAMALHAGHPRSPSTGARHQWTRKRLHSLITQRLEGFRFVCVGNREPYIHMRKGGVLRCIEPDSGVVTALGPVLRATGGTWVAHGSGSADRETADERGRLKVPPGIGHYTLRRIWLTPEEEQGYYFGLSNEGLWPLCHVAYERPSFREEDWRQYEAVNRKFADAVIDEVGSDRALIFIQDYHFSLLSKMIKQALPGAIVCQFWHIPWPGSETFRICPWGREILEGLLGNDLLAFHTQQHCNNFIDAVDRELESRIDRERFSVTLKGSMTLIRPHPISVDFDAISHAAEAPDMPEKIRALREQHHLGNATVLLSAGRMDYTKGVLERFQALGRLFDRHPELRGKIVLVEIGVPTRSQITAYRRFQEDVDQQARALNGKYGSAVWQPVRFIGEHQEQSTLTSFYRMADVCLVTSLSDGMNLVAKEFVSARTDERGVLVLSQFAGASRELTHAIPVNPYAVDAMADTFWRALNVPAEEQQARMRKMREAVNEHNVYRWAGKLLEQAAKLEPS